MVSSHLGTQGPAILQQSQENNFWAIVNCQACIPILQLKTSLLAPATHEIE